MISPKQRDMNRSRDVEGPELKRPYSQENEMKQDKGGLFHDSAPTGTLEKLSLSELHDGDHMKPLTALGAQATKVSTGMGEDHPDHTPSTQKGGGGAGKIHPGENMKGMGRSVAKEMMYAAKKRAK